MGHSWRYFQLFDGPGPAKDFIVCNYCRRKVLIEDLSETDTTGLCPEHVAT